MAAMVSEERMKVLLQPYLVRETRGVPEGMFGRLVEYLDLLLRWNAKTNLTAVRDPEEIVTRHFGESLFAGSVLGRVGETVVTVLDLGSGAGFPGVPMQLLRPDWQLVLGESQGKKAAFLREVVRQLGLGAEVWAARVESMPVAREFDAVVMRAVDRMEAMEVVGRSRVRAGGVMLRMVGGAGGAAEAERIPGTTDSYVELLRVEEGDVPRGTSA